MAHLKRLAFVAGTLLAPGRCPHIVTEGRRPMRTLKRVAMVLGTLLALLVAGGAHWRA